MALRNGTMGWELAGLSCERGSERRVASSRPGDVATALARADAFARASGVTGIRIGELRAFAEDATRTLYLLDVRDPREVREGHIAGSLNAPGGQLIQATDQSIAVRNSRIVLADDTGVRARMAAAWLRQMGHGDVFVLEGGLAAAGSISLQPAVAMPIPGVEAIDVHALHDLLTSPARLAVVDLARSIDFRAGHIPGSHWGVRTRLARLGPALAQATDVVITAPDEDVAKLAYGEVRALSGATVRILACGVRGWGDAGFPLAKDRSDPPDEDCIDVCFRPYERNTGVEAAMKAYLSWETGLIEQIKRDGTVEFNSGGPD